MRVVTQVLRVLAVSKGHLVPRGNLAKGVVQVLMEEEACQENLGRRGIEALMDFQVYPVIKVTGVNVVPKALPALPAKTE